MHIAHIAKNHYQSTAWADWLFLLFEIIDLSFVYYTSSVFCRFCTTLFDGPGSVLYCTAVVPIKHGPIARKQSCSLFLFVFFFPLPASSTYQSHEQWGSDAHLTCLNAWNVASDAVSGKSLFANFTFCKYIRRVTHRGSIRCKFN